MIANSVSGYFCFSYPLKNAFTFETSHIFSLKSLYQQTQKQTQMVKKCVFSKNEVWSKKKCYRRSSILPSNYQNHPEFMELNFTGCDLRFLLEWVRRMPAAGVLGLRGALWPLAGSASAYGHGVEPQGPCTWQWSCSRFLQLLQSTGPQRWQIFKARLEQQKMHCHHHSCP